MLRVGVPAASEEERLRRLNGPDVDVEGAVAVRVERDGGPAVRLQVEAVQKAALRKERRRAGAAVDEVRVALDALDPRAPPVERARLFDVVVPVRERLPPELELAVADATVPPHPVRRVEVEAPVVVEVGRDRAPVPARAPRARARGRVLERSFRRLE